MCVCVGKQYERNEKHCKLRTLEQNKENGKYCKILISSILLEQADLLSNC